MNFQMEQQLFGIVFFSFLLIQVLICRNYKGDVDMAEIDHFLPLLMQHEEEGLLCPVLSHGSVHFMWIKHTNLYCILFRDTRVMIL